MQDLPIYQVIPNIINSLVNTNNLVVQAQPGAGKSTVIPLELYKSGIVKGKIIMLEPRRMAARSIACFLAKKLGQNIGETIGYRIKNETKVSQKTKLEVVTEGVLTQLIQRDPELTGIDLIIFDEFHERNLHADLALMLTVDIQLALRDDLKVLAMSATIDTQEVSEYLSNAPVIKCDGRSFPVTLTYAGKSAEKLSLQVLKAISAYLSKPFSGSMLVFLPGKKEIMQCLELLQAHPTFKDIEVLPLYGAMPMKEQDYVIKESEQVRIILATNIAETSLTIPNIKVVVDSGLERVVHYDPKSGMSKMLTVKISKASTVQRAGRAGRLSSGFCTRLWAESEQTGLADFAKQEIMTSDLSQTLMELSLWGERLFKEANWLTAPPDAHIDSSLKLLKNLGLINADNTPSYKAEILADLPLSPRIANMLFQANVYGLSSLACDVAALISERDIIKNSHTVDFAHRYQMLSDAYQAKKIGKRPNTALQQIIMSANKLRQLNTKIGCSIEKESLDNNLKETAQSLSLQEQLGLLISFAYPERLSKQRLLRKPEYLLANGKGVRLRETDPLVEEQWLAVYDCDLSINKGSIFGAATISLATIKLFYAKQITQQSSVELQQQSGSFQEVLLSKYGELVLEKSVSNKVSQQDLLLLLKPLFLEKGQALLNWTKKCNNYLTRITWLQSQDEAFANGFDVWMSVDDWLLPYIGKVTNIKQLKNIDIFPLLKASLSWKHQQALEQNAPEQYITPSGKAINIIYDQNQGPTVSVILQEMFGEIQSPKIAGGKVNLRFELLSPARRAIQITSDLENFWQSSYFDVAKDMRAKYPKHRWPEKPLLEKAGKSIKQR